MAATGEEPVGNRRTSVILGLAVFVGVLALVGSSRAGAGDADEADGQAPAQRTARLTLTVETTSGAPAMAVADLFDAVSDGGRGTYRTSTAPDDGRVEFLVEPGCHVVVAIAPHGQRFVSGSRWSQQLACVDQGQVDLTTAVIDDGDQPPADHTMVLGGQVVGPTGVGVSSVAADLFAASSDGSRAVYLSTATSDGTGHYRFEPAPGCYVVVLVAPAGPGFDPGGPYVEHRICGAAGAWIETLGAQLSSPTPTPSPAPSPTPADPPDQNPVDPSGSIGFSPGGWFADEPDAELHADLDHMVEAGATWLRIDFDWSKIEATRGDHHWHRTDRVVDAARARGLKVLGLITEAPAWARPSGTDSKSPPSDPRHYAAFAAAAVERYHQRGVEAWELWNEPNLGMFWGPHPDPVAYVDLARPAVAAMRDVDPDVVILSGGLAPAADRADRTSVAPLTFTARLLDEGGDLFDGIAMHPFSYPARPIDPDSAAWNPFHNLPTLRQLLVDSGHGHLEIWLTEYGAPTGTSDRAVSEAEQSAQISEAITAATAWPWTGPIFLYSIRDERLAPGDFQANFGLFRHDGTAKQSWWDLLARTDP